MQLFGWLCLIIGWRPRPLCCGALGDGRYHSRPLLWQNGTCFMKWASLPLPRLSVPPSERTNTLESVGVILKTGRKEKKRRRKFWHFCSEMEEGEADVGGGDRRASDWRGKACFLLALRKGRPLLVPTALQSDCYFGHKSPFWWMETVVTWSAQGSFWFWSVQHLSVACGWGSCWRPQLPLCRMSVLCPPPFPFVCLSIGLPSLFCFFLIANFTASPKNLGGDSWENKVLFFFPFLLFLFLNQISCKNP